MNRIFLAQWTALVATIVLWSRALAADSPFIFRDVAEAAGLHEPLQGMMGHAAAWGDVDGDGWLDLFVGTFADRPAEQYRRGGAVGPVPNQLLLNRKGQFLPSNQQALAWLGRASGSVFADFDNDGRLDIFLPSWWPKFPSMLLKNETPTGGYVDVTVVGPKGVNRMGIGATVRAYKAGRAGKSDAMLASEEISTGYGFCSGQPAVAHLGLGMESTCDLVIRLPHGKGLIVRRNAKVNQRLRIDERPSSN